jgi:hypothetical protein
MRVSAQRKPWNAFIHLNTATGFRISLTPCMYICRRPFCIMLAFIGRYLASVIMAFQLILSSLCKVQMMRHFANGNRPEGLTDQCKSSGFHGGDCEECRLLGYKIPVHTSQETHCVSVTEQSQLIICKIWGLHDDDYEECSLLGYRNPVHTSQETYFSAIESSRLMLCKIWGFHGGDYEECRLLGCRNPVRNSEERNYLSATGSSRLMQCKIWGFHGCDYDECCLLGCYVVWLL